MKTTKLPKKVYRNEIAEEIFENDDTGYETAKYINSYVYKIINPVSYLMWDPSLDEFTHYNYTNLFGSNGVIKNFNKTLIRKNKVKSKDGKNKTEDVKIEINVKNILKNEYMKDYTQFLDMQKPLTWVDEETERRYINLYPGPPYDLSESYKNMPQNVIDTMMLIWKHFKIVWCNNNEDQYNFLHKWMCWTVAGIKTGIAVIGRSDEGMGKSVITDFLLEYVLTQRLAYKDERSSITDRFNKMMEGKCLMINEEFHMNTKGEFLKAINIIKDLITGSTMTIETKGIDKYTVKNNLNFLFISNYDSIRPTNDSKRRWFTLDFLRNTEKPDREYYSKLYKIEKNKEVAKCFYRYCVENVDPTFKPYDEVNKIMTESKHMSIVDNLEDCRKLMKSKYIKEKIDLYNKPFKAFWDIYMKKYKIDEKYETQHKRDVMNILRRDGIVIKKYGEKHNMTIFTHTNEIYETYNKNGWIIDDDEINYDTDEIDTKEVKSDTNTTCGFVDEYEVEDEHMEIALNSRDKEIADLKKQLEDFKKQNIDKDLIIEQLQKQNIDKDSIIEGLKKQIDEVKANKQEVKANEIEDDGYTIIKELKKQLAQKDNKINEYEEYCDEVADYDELVEKVDKLEKDKEQLVEDYNELVDKYNNLDEKVDKNNEELIKKNYELRVVQLTTDEVMRDARYRGNLIKN